MNAQSQGERQTEDDGVIYHLIASDSEQAQFALRLSDVDFVNYCIENRYCIAEKYPILNIPLEWRRNNFKRYGKSNTSH